MAGLSGPSAAPSVAEITGPGDVAAAPRAGKTAGPPEAAAPDGEITGPSAAEYGATDPTAGTEHDAIVDAIRTGNASAAQRAVQTNWRHASDRLVKAIEVMGEQGNW